MLPRSEMVVNPAFALFAELPIRALPWKFGNFRELGHPSLFSRVLIDAVQHSEKPLEAVEHLPVREPRLPHLLGEDGYVTPPAHHEMRSAARFDRAAARWGNPPGRPAAEEPSSTAAVRLSLPFQILRNRLPCALPSPAGPNHGLS